MLRLWLPTTILLAAALTASAALRVDHDAEPAAGTSPRNSAQAQADATPPGQCARLCLEVARQLTAEAMRHSAAAEDAAAQRNLETALRYAARAADDARLTHKRLKENEMALRKMARSLRQLAASLPASERPPLESAARGMDSLSETLLNLYLKVPPKQTPLAHHP
jgi:hypothetical protein